MERFEGRDRGAQRVLIAPTGKKDHGLSFSGTWFATLAYKNMRYSLKHSSGYEWFHWL